MKNLPVLFAFILITQLSSAQSGLKLPETNPDLAKEKYALLSDEYKSEAYDKSYDALLWIMAFAPDMHESVYILGQKAIKKLLENEPTNQDYKQSLMQVYDNRIKYFGNEVKVMSRKAFDAYKYYRDDPDFLSETIKIFEDLYAKEGNNLKENLLYPFFDLKIIQRKNELINDEELIKAYEKISDVIISKLEEDEDENLLKVQKLIDAKLARSVPLDCQRIDQLFAANNKGEKFSSSQAKLIVKLSLAYECTKEAYFITAIKVLFEENPSVKLARIIASYHLENKAYRAAIDYFDRSLLLAQEIHEKSMIYFDLANVYSAKGDKVNARAMAYESLKTDPNNLVNYRLIGDLYYNSYDDCKKGKSRVEDRSVFFAAFEKYVLAKDPAKMSLAEQQFPSMESIHTENYQEGQLISTNCWIGEQVKVRRRPSLASN